MQFCPKCGVLMLPKRSEGKSILSCSSCGHVSEKELDEYKIAESVKQRREVAVIEEEKSTLPTVKVECPKCGYETAYWWIQQTRAADEASTRFYRCKRCRYTWREYT